MVADAGVPEVVSPVANETEEIEPDAALDGAGSYEEDDADNYNGDDDPLAAEFDEVCDKARELNLLDDAEYDIITDTVAAGAVALEAALEEIRAAIDDFECGGEPAALGKRPLFARSAGAEPSSPSSVLAVSPLPEPPARMAVVVDVHYLQVAVKAFSLSGSWSISAFEKALVAACGSTGTIVKRFACDSSKEGGASPLHAALVSEGYELVLSPPKPSNGMQGATDVDVACCIFAVAGAFAAQPVADTLVLIAGDSDFRPALVAALGSDRSLQVAVVAETHQLGKSYRTWIDETAHVAHIELAPLLGGQAPGVIDLRGASRPAAGASGRADVGAVLAACEAAVASGCDTLTLNLSGKNREAEWGDAETASLCACLRGGTPQGAVVAPRLQQLWLHHTVIGDAACTALATLLGATCPKLEQIHLSDSRVSCAGLEALTTAAVRAGYGKPAGRTTKRKLYINARHLSDGASHAAAAAAAAACLVRLFDLTRVGDRVGTLNYGAGSSPGGRGGGRGKGSGSGKGDGSPGRGKGKGGSSPSGKGGSSPSGKGGYNGGKGGGAAGADGAVLYTPNARGGKGQGRGAGSGKGGGRGPPGRGKGRGQGT